MIRLLLAVSVSFVFSLLGTKALIDLLTRYQIGQTIREDGPEGHHTKAGTPTMGGVAIVVGAVAGYIVSNFLSGVIRDQDAFVYTRSGLFVMLAIIGGGAVGLMDDWIGVVRERNLGLNKRAKLIGPGHRRGFLRRVDGAVHLGAHRAVRDPVRLDRSRPR